MTSAQLKGRAVSVVSTFGVSTLLRPPNRCAKAARQCVLSPFADIGVQLRMKGLVLTSENISKQLIFMLLGGSEGDDPILTADGRHLFAPRT